MTSAPSTGARPTLRIAYITKTPLPSTDAATIQIIQTASALARAGASLDLFFPMGEGERRRPLEALRARLSEHYGAELDFGLRQLRYSSRALHAVKAGLAAASDGYDVLHTRDVQNVLLGLATGCRVVYESYRTPEGNTPIVKSLLRRAFGHPRFLGQIIHSRFARERHLEAGYPGQKLRTIYNGFDPAAFATERSPSEARRLLGLPERVTVVYAGRIAPLKRIDLLLAAARATPELSWVLAGANESAEARPFAAQGAALPNVAFLGYLPGPALTPALQAADILVIPPSAEPLERYGTTVLPLKIFQYLAAGRPLVVGDVPDTAELLEEGAACLRVAPEQIDPFIAAIRALATDPERRGQMGETASTLAQGLTWDARARQIITYLSERLDAIGYR
ncbi:MAG TPA: glycosyltransferase family 4 protein [Gemmatimonadales bacterium]|jgi:glycosyltransferase involved in cell wall biosynthesis|nr:glycosyltransferase family 4 protein [Gemmatimonadales bacterium]